MALIAGSQWNNSGDLWVGDFGNGTLNVEAGGAWSPMDSDLREFSPFWRGVLREEIPWQSSRFATTLTVAQDDFQRATNFRGHWAGLDVYPWEDVQLRLWLLSAEPMMPVNGSEETEWRARADLTVYF